MYRPGPAVRTRAAERGVARRGTDWSPLCSPYLIRNGRERNETRRNRVVRQLVAINRFSNGSETTWKPLNHRNGGECGIRTHGTLSRTHAFQACALNRSANSPDARFYQRQATAERVSAVRSRRGGFAARACWERWAPEGDCRQRRAPQLRWAERRRALAPRVWSRHDAATASDCKFGPAHRVRRERCRQSRRP